MNKVYKAFFLKKLRKHLEAGELSLPPDFPLLNNYQIWKEKLYTKEWVVYAKPPFGGVKHVINYVARYSHRIALSNHRIENITEQTVTFKYRDYADHAKSKSMTLPGQVFLQRFCLHILPNRFRKIRHFGFCANSIKTKKIAQAKMALVQKKHIALSKQERKALARARLFKKNNQCPNCKTGLMITVEVFESNKDPPIALTLL